MDKVVFNNSSSSTIKLFGTIGDWWDDADFESFYKSFDRVVNSYLNGSVSSIPRIEINSGGGDILDGFAIYDHIQASGVSVQTVNMGFCGSMAGIIFQAGSERIARANSTIMVHKATAGVRGNSDEVRAVLEALEALEGRLKGVYLSKVPVENSAIVESWFSGGDHFIVSSDALQYNLIDKLEPSALAAVPALSNELQACKFYNLGALGSTPSNKKNTDKMDFGFIKSITGKTVENSQQAEQAIKDHLESELSNLRDLNNSLKNQLAERVVNAHVLRGAISEGQAEVYKMAAVSDFDKTAASLEAIATPEGKLDVQLSEDDTLPPLESRKKNQGSDGSGVNDALKELSFYDESKSYKDYTGEQLKAIERVDPSVLASLMTERVRSVNKKYFGK